MKNLFYDQAHKNVAKYLLLAGKLNKLLHALNRPSVQRFMNNLQKITTNKNIGDKLRNITNKKNVKNNNDKLGRYLNKWKNIVDNIKTQENDSASLIQRAFLSLRARNRKNNLLGKKTMITPLRP